MLRRIVMTLVAAVAIGGFVFVFTSPKQDDVGKLPPEVESVYPTGGNLDLRQVTITADLVAGFTGVLSLDGVELPLDQQVIQDELGTVTFRPTAGDFGALEPGPHCATVKYRRIGRPDDATESFRWCFSLH